MAVGNALTGCKSDHGSWTVRTAEPRSFALALRKTPDRMLCTSRVHTRPHGSTLPAEVSRPKSTEPLIALGSLHLGGRRHSATLQIPPPGATQGQGCPVNSNGFFATAWLFVRRHISRVDVTLGRGRDCMRNSLIKVSSCERGAWHLWRRGQTPRMLPRRTPTGSILLVVDCNGLTS